MAVRTSEIYCQDDRGGVLFNFNPKKLSVSMGDNLEKYVYFMEETGLFNLLRNHIINNLVDYVMGIETGLDSNGRKNRGGHLMEDLVEQFIIKAGFVKGINYFKEMYIHEITENGE